jgi:hypothetical protein
METAEQIRQSKYSAAESLGSLSLGTFIISLIGSVQWATIALIIFGAIFALGGIYLIIPCNLKQEWFLRKVATKKTMVIFKYLGWLLILARFGYDLMRTDIIWLKIIGILFAISAYVVLYTGIWRARKIKD